MKNEKLLRYELYFGWLLAIALILVMMGMGAE